MQTVLERLSAFAVDYRSAAPAGEVLHHAKRAVLDWVAVLIAGSAMPPATLLEEALGDVGASGPCSLGSGKRAGARSAALINGAASHTVELDDIYREAVYHPGSPVIAAALAAAEQRGVDGATFLRAVIVGYETSTRIGQAVMPAHYRYWHTTGTIGTIGAAAAAAEVFGLDARSFAHAMATATTFAAGLQQAFRSDAMSKPLHAGHAADAGLLAALAAAKGVTGALDIVEGEYGLANASGAAAVDWDGALSDLGRHFNITRMTFKSHSCCGHTFAAIDAVLQLRRQHGIGLADVAGVEIRTYRAAIDVAGNPDPTTEFEAKFSLPYVVAVALRDGVVLPTSFEDRTLGDPAIRRTLPLVEIAEDPGMTARFPKQRSAFVRITLRSGEVLEHLQPHRMGDPELALSDAALAEKYFGLVTPRIGKDAAEAIYLRIRELDMLPDARLLLGAAE